MNENEMLELGLTEGEVALLNMPFHQMNPEYAKMAHKARDRYDMLRGKK